MVSGLYDFIHRHKENTHLSVGIHNTKSRNMIMCEIKKFLTGPLNYEVDNTDQYHISMIITDANNVKIKVEYNWWFHQGAIVKNPETSGYTLHTSDVNVAHNNCHSKYCFHMMHGKLYKCGAVALFPEFDQQHHFDLSPSDRQLLESYRLLSITDNFEFKQQFIADLPNPIAQCRFCPEVYCGTKIFAEEKKIIFKK